jgi:hypothetical protein
MDVNTIHSAGTTALPELSPKRNAIGCPLAESLTERRWVFDEALAVRLLSATSNVLRFDPWSE